MNSRRAFCPNQPRRRRAPVPEFAPGLDFLSGRKLFEIFIKKDKIMKSLIIAIALACAAVAGSVQAAGTSCPTCCKDKDCATCCKGKCSECKQCNK